MGRASGFAACETVLGGGRVMHGRVVVVMVVAEGDAMLR